MNQAGGLWTGCGITSWRALSSDSVDSVVGYRISAWCTVHLQRLYEQTGLKMEKNGRDGELGVVQDLNVRLWGDVSHYAGGHDAEKF